MKKSPLILPFPLQGSLNSAFILMLVLALTIAQLTACNPAPDPNATGANPPATQAGQPTTAEQPAAGNQATTAGQAIPVGQSSTREHPTPPGKQPLPVNRIPLRSRLPPTRSPPLTPRPSSRLAPRFLYIIAAAWLIPTSW